MSKHTKALANYKSKLIDRIANLDPKLAASLRDIKLDWYRISNNADDSGSSDVDNEKTDVFIYDEIGGSFGVSADEFVKDLQNITTPNIEVRINSPGGSLFDSIAIHNALIKHSAKVTTVVDALAASGASIVAMAGDEVIMMRGSQMMIHDALGMELGNAKDMRAMATFLDRQSDNIASIYADKAGGELADWRAKMLAETWLFANEAIELGLADKMFTPELPKSEENEEDAASEGDEKEGEETGSEEDESEEDIQVLMTRRHSLANKGFKYAGRNKAPNPLNDVNRAELVNILKNSLAKVSR